jgi:hypothetical protein
MNLRQRLKNIIEFLKPYQNIWQNEIMLIYPDALNDYPEEWLQDLLRFKSREDLIKLERKQVEGMIQNPSLIQFYEDRQKLIDVPFTRAMPPMPETPFTFLFMIPKKQHEIKKLAPLIHHYYQTQRIEKIIDIGGGIGLLAQTLVNQYNHQVCSVDLDPTMQATGLSRHQKNATNLPNLVEYKTLKVEEKNKAFSALLSPNFMTVGLHTCGSLAVAQLKASTEKKIKNIVNFGCCYHKIDKLPDQHISQFVQEIGPLNLSKFALTLASRAHLKLAEDDFDFKLKVKYYRYAIHFLLCDLFQKREIVTLGNSKKDLYNESFGIYAKEQLSRIGLEGRFSEVELDQFFNTPERLHLIERMLAAGIIRDSFGRLLELYLLLDRAVYLEEQGYEVHLEQCFDETISPRNIGLFSQFK